MRLWIAKFFWFFERLFAKFRTLNEAQRDELIGYHETSMRIFDAIGIDIKTKPIEQRRLYNSMLVYLDREQVICPSGARTAMLINLLEICSSDWTLPPSNLPVSTEFALEIEGYLALEIMRNTLGIKDIRDELVNAMASSKYNF